MYCKHCGNEIDDNSKFCPGCGEKLTTKKAEMENSGNEGKYGSKLTATRSEKKVNVNIANTQKTEITNSKVARSYETASQGKRFLNYLIDLFFAYITTFVVGIIFGFLLVMIGNETLLDDNNTDYDFIYTFLGLFSFYIYYFTFEAIWGKTIGKIITRTKVVDATGSKPSVGRIAKRSLCRFIPFDALSFLTSSPVGWHDSVSKTRVVQKNK